MGSVTDIGSPIKLFIEKVRKETTDGLGDWELKAPVELELNAIVNEKVGGEMDIQIINFGAKVEAEQQHKIKLSLGRKNDVEEVEKQSRIAEAKAKEKYAKKFGEYGDLINK